MRTGPRERRVGRVPRYRSRRSNMRKALARRRAQALTPDRATPRYQASLHLGTGVRAVFRTGIRTTDPPDEGTHDPFTSRPRFGRRFGSRFGRGNPADVGGEKVLSVLLIIYENQALGPGAHNPLVWGIGGSGIERLPRLGRSVVGIREASYYSYRQYGQTEANHCDSSRNFNSETSSA